MIHLGRIQYGLIRIIVRYVAFLPRILARIAGRLIRRVAGLQIKRERASHHSAVSHRRRALSAAVGPRPSGRIRTSGASIRWPTKASTPRRGLQKSAGAYMIVLLCVTDKRSPPVFLGEQRHPTRPARRFQRKADGGKDVLCSLKLARGACNNPVNQPDGPCRARGKR